MKLKIRNKIIFFLIKHANITMVMLVFFFFTFSIINTIIWFETYFMLDTPEFHIKEIKAQPSIFSEPRKPLPMANPHTHETIHISEEEMLEKYNKIKQTLDIAEIVLAGAFLVCAAIALAKYFWP